MTQATTPHPTTEPSPTPTSIDRIVEARVERAQAHAYARAERQRLQALADQDFLAVVRAELDASPDLTVAEVARSLGWSPQNIYLMMRRHPADTTTSMTTS